MKDFTGKTAVITGAASGIGLALAKLFSEQGMRLVLADIQGQPLEKLVSELKAAGAQVIGVVTDVGDAESVENLAQTATDQFGTIDIVCNNAGVYTGGQLWEATIDDYEWLIRVNQWGIIHGIRSFIPRMIAQDKECHMVNTASMAAVTTMPYAGIYHMTKHAALALSESLYHELSLSHPLVKVSCLCPELFATGIAHSDRNRPAALAEINQSDTWQMAHTAIADATRASSDPRILAERTLQAIRDEQFYIMPPKQDPWSATADIRLEDLLQRRNPTFAPPAL